MIDTQDRLDFKYPYDLLALNLPFLYSQQKLLVKILFSWISINSKFENQRNKKLLNWEKSLKQIKRKLKGWNKIENSSQLRHESYLNLYLWGHYLPLAAWQSWLLDGSKSNGSWANQILAFSFHKYYLIHLL